MNPSDSPKPVCPRCGTSLLRDAPEGLCPRCLAEVNFATGSLLTGAGAALPPPTIEEIAPHFPQLEILTCLGRGGMGVVYQARQKSLNRIVALKLLAPEREKDPEFSDRFAREAQALAKMSHPHIVTVHDFGQVGGFFYLLMEFVDGVNLRQLLTSHKLTPEQALAIVPPLCDALQYAHDQGIVHRDIKPENLLMDKQGRVKVADFGLAKMLGSDPVPDEKPVGTPSYMAPEQVADPTKVDSRADIYSLGVVFYEMLTGELPSKQLQPPSRKVAIDVRLDEIVLRALEREPGLRWQQASILKTQVEMMKPSAESITSTPSAAASPVAKRALILFLAAIILPPSLYLLANNNARIVNVAGAIGAILLLVSFLFGILTWKHLPGRIAAIGAPALMLSLLGIAGYPKAREQQAALEMRQRIDRRMNEAHFKYADKHPPSPRLVAKPSYQANQRPVFKVEWPASRWRARNAGALIANEHFFLRVNDLDYHLRTAHAPYDVSQFELDPTQEVAGEGLVLAPGKYLATYIVRNVDYFIPDHPDDVYHVQLTSNEAEFEIEKWPVLEAIFTAWKSGNETEAASLFTRAKWGSETLFYRNSLAGLSEDRFEALPAAERQARSGEIQETVEILRKLAAIVKDAGAEAAVAKDFSRARECYTALSDCGRTLRGAQCLLVLQLLGAEMEKQAAAQLALIPANKIFNRQQTEPPQLRYLAWLDEVRENADWQVWDATGRKIAHQQLHLPPWLTTPTGVDISQTAAAAQKPRFLSLWFSHPAFDAQTVVKIKLLDDAAQPLITPDSNMGSGVSPPADDSENLGWITASLCAGSLEKTPDKVNIQLEYSAGPWIAWKNVPADFHGSMALSDGVFVTDPGQGADGKAFMQIDRDSTLDPNNEQFDFLAITQDGASLARQGVSQSGTGNISMERLTFDLPLNRVKGFQCRRRPIQAMIWNNIPLRSANIAPVVINALADGSYSIGSEKFDSSALTARLKKLANEEPRISVVIRSDTQTSYAKVVAVLDACREAGIINVAFAGAKKE